MKKLAEQYVQKYAEANAEEERNKKSSPSHSAGDKEKSYLPLL